MNNTFSTLALIIGRRNYHEADRLLTFFTEKNGKIVVRAKGVRLSQSKRQGHIELFNTIKAQIIEGRGFPILAQTELIEDRSLIKSDLKLLRIAYHLTELVSRLTPEHEKHQEIFDLLNRALSSINLGIWDKEGYLSEKFEEKLLRLLGYGVPPDGNSWHEYIESIADFKLRSQEILNIG
ncbi:DNA repair protein RecO [Candidatus Collierbacteria bacterium]|nr:DNA repair protein RecO [Candidatus Collierbacteria bacterium]